MTWAWEESAVSLDKLDDHLRALLRLKIREFVHLSPWFKETPLVDQATLRQKRQPVQFHSNSQLHVSGDACPNKRADLKPRRRQLRAGLHTSAII